MRLDARLNAKFARLARKTGLSKTQLVEALMRQAVEEDERKNQDKVVDVEQI